MKIVVAGDIHANWEILKNMIDKESPDIILQCGDFGFWPKFFYWPNFIYKMNGLKTKIYWCDGNHECHWSLSLLFDNNEVLKNVFYMKRGSTLTLPDGRNILFMGGANSIDKHIRTIGVDWFPEETISQRDIERLPESKIDIVISHTAPEEFDVVKVIDDNDPSRKALSYVLEKYQPSLWYFGHFHQYKTGKYNNCEWTCLDECRNENWWKVLR
jgi:Icc-related predicted phosphoesterase